MAKSSHAGRPSSWLAVVVMWIGFIAGGIALVMGPTWWLFWAGAAIVAVGGIFGLAVGIFSDVILDAPRVVPAENLPSQEIGHRGGAVEPGVATDPATTRPHG